MTSGSLFPVDQVPEKPKNEPMRLAEQRSLPTTPYYDAHAICQAVFGPSSSDDLIKAIDSMKFDTGKADISTRNNGERSLSSGVLAR
jgi:hypothetical protein